MPDCPLQESQHCQKALQWTFNCYPITQTIQASGQSLHQASVQNKAGATCTRGCTSLVPDHGLLQRLQDEDSSNQGVGELSMKQQGNISDTWIESQEYAKAPEHTRRWILETISVFADSAEMNLANMACHTRIYQFKLHLYDGDLQPNLYVKNDLWSLTERCRHGKIQAETGAFMQHSRRLTLRQARNPLTVPR